LPVAEEVTHDGHVVFFDVGSGLECVDHLPVADVDTDVMGVVPAGAVEDQVARDGRRHLVHARQFFVGIAPA
jgi:hypothetical protein